jgi:hypothetical protein
MHPFKSLALTLGAVVPAMVASHSFAAGSCSVRSTSLITPVVELYTSEGCSSCPPADKWLSRLKADPSIVALAFHVDYWDRLGWKDRFGSAAYTQRQAQEQMTSGARFGYTPQVIVDGADRPDWPGIGASIASRDRPAARVDVQLMRDGNHFSATVAPTADAPARLAAYWAVTEQGHVSAVKGGENAGVTLNHDYVVREYRTVPAWSAKASGPATTLQFDVAGAADPAHVRQVNLVIVNADNGRPVQAVKLGC